MPRRRPALTHDLRLMQCFVLLAEERHCERAARSLGVSPSSVSRAVKQLEADLGCELLVHRQGRTGDLTNAGEIVLAAGKDLLARHARLVAELAESQSAFRNIRGPLLLPNCEEVLHDRQAIR